MTDPTQRPRRHQFSSHVRIAVQGKADVLERYAANLSQGGLFVRDDAPPAIGSIVLIEFVLPDGTPLSRITGRVVHARPATTPGERNAGMGVQFVDLDVTANELVKALRARKPAQTTPPRLPGSPSPAEELVPDVSAKRMDGIVVGIDLGTVNSCIAVVRDGKPRVLRSARG
ncbi:MAG: PilZ domain-containing protein, partial [Clostridia bacterium]|nr:PilZ domain-containing protein [Deltaproteobacteria bacterium]